MGKRGPAKKPTALRLLEGNPGHLPINPREPMPPRSGIVKPAWLGQVASEHWDEHFDVLDRIGVFTRVDSATFARYCDLWEKWKAARDFITDKGTCYPIKNFEGEVIGLQRYPQMNDYNQLSQQITRLEQEFGMTPSSRTGIQTVGHKEPSIVNGKSRFFSTA